MNAELEVQEKETEPEFNPVLSILVSDEGQLQVNAPDDMPVEVAIGLLAQAQLVVLEAVSGDDTA